MAENKEPRVERLVVEMKAWIERNHIAQKDLAVLLGMTPQGITEIFSGRNRPTADQVLRMLEIMAKEKRK
jgi:transcriptional regulator with XRE-family HTH domain